MNDAPTGEAARIVAIVRKRFAAIADDPEERYRYAENFYDANPVPGPDWYGRSELAFMRWEIERGVLNPPHQRTAPGSPWWRSVNARILRDQDEGSMLAVAGIVSDDNPAANRWSEYLREPSPVSWYRAHNASVVSGYVRAAALAGRELPAEQFLMNLVLARVLFAQALAEEATFAVGGHPLLAAFLSDPRLPAVTIAMQVPDFYPRSYPLDAGEEAVLSRRAHTHNEQDVSPIDADPCSHIEDLFAFAGKSLGDDLSRFLARGIVCYPHGLLGASTMPPVDDRVWLPWLAHDVVEQGRWTDELLDGMRHRGDPIADEVVRGYFEEFGGGPHEFFTGLVARPDPTPEECSPAVAAYLGERPPLPTWTDPDRLRLGEDFFGRWGLYVPLVLICSSLPECYGAAKGVQVLHLTARLASDTRRRIVETAQMVLDVMAPGGMEIDAPGYRTVRRVRLMHAGVRYLIQHDPRIGRDAAADHVGPRWSADWGVPINQEDLAGTLTTFSWSVVTGLRSLGVPVSEEEADAYLHAWNVIGSMMGVREEMLPKDYDDADLLAHRIRERQWKTSPEGREMTSALVEMLDASRPGRMVPGFSGTMIRHFVGDELANDLGVPSGGRAGSLLRRASATAIAAGLAQQHSRAARRVAGMVSRALLKSYTTFDRGAGRATFEIPTRLADAWNLRTARTR